MLHLIETTTGLIIFTILYILIVWIPLFLLLRKMLQPEHIEIENGRVKMKDLTIFFNLALENPIYVKLTIFTLFIMTFISFVMFYFGFGVESFNLVFKLFIWICVVLLIIQCVEERKMLYYAFLPIIATILFFARAILGLLILIGITLKKILEFIMVVFFILPFKILIKIFESK